MKTSGWINSQVIGHNLIPLEIELCYSVWMRKGEVIGCVHLFALKKPTSFLGLSVCLLALKKTRPVL